MTADPSRLREPFMKTMSPRTAAAARATALCLALAVPACSGTGRSGADLAANPDALELRLADATMSAGSPATALRILDDDLRRHPHDAPALLRRGRAEAALGQSADAAQSFASALAVTPRSLEALTGLARARAAGGDAVGSEAAWRQAAALAPDDAQVETGLAIALDLQERHSEAQALYHAVLARVPDDAVARCDLGFSLALSGHAAEGLPLLQQAAQGGIGGNPAMTVRARHNLAVGLMMAGDEGQARRVLSQDLAPADVDTAVAGLRQFAAAQ